MNTLAKLLRASPGRKTRLHTEDGKLIGLRELAEYPALVARRVYPHEPRPWMTRGAISELERRLAPDNLLLECGAGESTVWYARRVARVVSLEHNAEWGDAVRGMLAAANRRNVEVITTPLASFTDYVTQLPPASVDVVVVDCAEDASVTRVDCVAAARDKVKSGGTLVLDDSDRPSLAPAMQLLAEWGRADFIGAKPRPLMVTRTSLFLKP